jgi:hypothetical protein
MPRDLEYPAGFEPATLRSEAQPKHCELKANLEQQIVTLLKEAS